MGNEELRDSVSELEVRVSLVLQKLVTLQDRVLELEYEAKSLREDLQTVERWSNL
jgi:hypothetical protein